MAGFSDTPLESVAINQTPEGFEVTVDFGGSRYDLGRYRSREATQDAGDKRLERLKQEGRR